MIYFPAFILYQEIQHEFQWKDCSKMTCKCRVKKDITWIVQQPAGRKHTLWD